MFSAGNTKTITLIRLSLIVVLFIISTSVVVTLISVTTSYDEIRNNYMSFMIFALVIEILAIAGSLVLFIKLKALVEGSEEEYTVTLGLLQSMPFVVNIWDESYVLQEASTQAIKMFNMTSVDEYIRRFDELSPTHQPCGTLSTVKLDAHVKQAFDEGTAKFDWMHRLIDGELIPTEVSVMRYTSGKRVRVAAFVIDLRKERRLRNVAEQQNEAKTRFLAHMSHEIRTPMNSIMSITEIQLQKDNHSADTIEALNRIYNASRILITIINDLLDLSKVAANKLKIVPEVYETSHLITESTYLNHMYSNKENINFVLDVSPDIPTTLIGDETRIRQILNNILSNAFKYTAEGTIKMTFTVEKTDEFDTVLKVSVSDTGYGMTKEQVNSLSEEFVRFHTERNANIEGSGLGMSIVFSMLEKMTGKIEIDSEPDKGSNFTVYIPQKKSGLEVIGKSEAERLCKMKNSKDVIRASAIRYEPMPHGKVLVVDDVESNLYVVNEMLKSYQLTVDTALSGQEAIEKIEDGNVYDIIFMDHMMPKMDGIEASIIIRNMGYTEPIVALTANAMVSDFHVYISHDFSDYIAKPINPRKLDACLKRFISSENSEKPKVISNNGEISQMLIKSFLVDAERFIHAITPLVEAGDLNEDELKLYQTLVHGIKSALANVQLYDLSTAASALENACLSGVIVQKDTRLLLKGINNAITVLSTQVAETDEPANDELREMLDTLACACEDCSLADMRNGLKKIKKSQLSAQSKNLIDKIEQLILVGNYNEAAAVARMG